MSAFSEFSSRIAARLGLGGSARQQQALVLAAGAALTLSLGGLVYLALRPSAKAAEAAAAAEDEDEEEEEEEDEKEAGGAAPAAASGERPAAGGAPPSAAAARGAAAAAAVAAPGELISKAALVSILKTMISKLDELKTTIETDKARMVTLAGLPPDEVEERSHAALQAGLQRVEAEIRAEAGVDQEHVMAAQAAYADDPAVEPLVAQLRSLFFGEEQLAELAAAQAAVPAGWVAADFVGPLKKHAAVVDARFAAIVERAARDTAGHGVSPGEVEQYLMMLLQREIDSILADAADAAGLSKDAFHGCMVKFGVDAAVAGVLADSNARQEALKASLLSGAASAGGGGGARGGARGGQTR